MNSHMDRRGLMEEQKKNIVVYHRILSRENFETAAKNLIHLLADVQEKNADMSRILYVDIDGHRNQNGGFGKDMLEL